MKNKVILNKEFLNTDEKIKIALDFINNCDFNKMPNGKIPIKNDEIWANLQTYTTKPDAMFEAHKKYIDIQYIISGNENIEISDYDNCSKETSYNTDNDIEFLESNDSEIVNMTEKDFLILYPNDAHKPSISTDKTNPDEVRKLVIKIKVD